MARDENPYAPPGEDEESPPSSDNRMAFEPASRGARFVGSLIDGVINMVVIFGAMGATGDLGSLFSISGRKQLGLGYWVATFAVLALQAALIARSGQSVGKLVMRTRIVREDGRTAGLEHGFLLRTIPITVIGLAPTVLLATGMDAGSVSMLNMLTGLFAISDAIFIFGDRRRCLHDRIAGTYVAVVGTQRAVREPEPAPRKKKKKKRKAAPAD